MPSLNPKYHTKWSHARKVYLSYMRLCDQNYEMALNTMLSRRNNSYEYACKGDYKAEISMIRLSNAITYAINLAFGTDLNKGQ